MAQSYIQNADEALAKMTELGTKINELEVTVSKLKQAADDMAGMNNNLCMSEAWAPIVAQVAAEITGMVAKYQEAEKTFNMFVDAMGETANVEMHAGALGSD